MLWDVFEIFDIDMRTPNVDVFDSYLKYILFYIYSCTFIFPGFDYDYFIGMNTSL